MSEATGTSRRTLTLGLAAVLAAVFAGSPFATRAQEVERNAPPEARIRPEARLVPQRQWEYKQLPCVPTAPLPRDHGEFADKLNEDGKRGWELVSLVEVQHPPGRECLLATFKRQVLN
jgi:uncharacterized protein DUF4177